MVPLLPQTLLFLLLLLLQSLTTPASALPRKARTNVGGGSRGAAPTSRTTAKVKSPGVIAGIALGSAALVVILLAVFIWRRKVWQDREDLEREERRSTPDDTASPMVVVAGRGGSLEDEEERGFVQKESVGRAI
ncbi:unnamed protein product [Tuber aestivum]|uniref:Mid2 domain-containing protein n=1 Tax=Tuber aestivum TaxID=59557 RepID=A0A292Q0W3_9PEZI|nr:unnamed protein product [Tuber aestivum]